MALTLGWTPEQLDLIGPATELEIAVPRSDGTQGSWTPIWMVHSDGDVFVRTWHRRTTGWFGRILRTERARVRLPGLEVEVRAEDVGAEPAALRAAIDDAYRAKYGGSAADRMAGDEAAATTLRLLPE